MDRLDYESGSIIAGLRRLFTTSRVLFSLAPCLFACLKAKRNRSRSLERRDQERLSIGLRLTRAALAGLCRRRGPIHIVLVIGPIGMLYNPMAAMNSPIPTRNRSLAFWMIAGGLLATSNGASAMQKQWAYRTFEAKLCDLSILLAGIVLLAAGAAGLLVTGYSRAAYGAGALAAGVFAMTLFVGIATGVIPCSGPG
jgi:hypothetical protein